VIHFYLSSLLTMQNACCFALSVGDEFGTCWTQSKLDRQLAGHVKDRQRLHCYYHVPTLQLASPSYRLMCGRRNKSEPVVPARLVIVASRGKNLLVIGKSNVALVGG
jgi:hypothetical protein